MTEHKEGHRKSAAHSARHLARVFVMLGLYQWLADPSQDYAGIEAHLSSLLHDEEEQLEGSDIRPTDFEKADRELFTKLLAGVLDRLVKQFGSGYRFTNAVLELVAREVRPEETAAPRA